MKPGECEQYPKLLFVGRDSVIHLEFNTDNADTLRKDTQGTKTRCRLWNRKHRRTTATSTSNTTGQARQDTFETSAILLAKYDI